MAFTGLNVLIDPCLSNRFVQISSFTANNHIFRCSPLPFIGPKRLIPLPCRLKELPKIDVILISHNQFAFHFIGIPDAVVMTTWIWSRSKKSWMKRRLSLCRSGLAESSERPNAQVSLKPIGGMNTSWVEEMTYPSESVRFLPAIPASDSTTRFEQHRAVATPSQHFTGRAIRDRNKSLWCSWVILTREERFFFAG